MKVGIMKIIVTESGGQLGSELCRQVGNDCVGLDLPEFDLADSNGVRDRLAQFRPDVVINTAAYTQVDKAEEEVQICRAVNAEAVRHLADACCEINAVLV